ncbi:MAG: ROK family protein [Lachnospiraceae bacterium]|nr:ROK family protein [Lachnospiraceae bacterium]
MKVSNTRDVKQNNLKLVKEALKNVTYGTKNSIAQATGLSIGTCNTILNLLEMTGEIIEIENPEITFGRPSKAYKFNADYAYVCCVIVKHVESQMRQPMCDVSYAVVNLVGEIKDEGEVRIDEYNPETLADAIKEPMQKYEKIQTISLGSPGYYYNNVLSVSGSDTMDGQDPVGYLAERYGCEVFIMNDMNAMAFGLHTFDKEISREDDMVMVGFFKGRPPGAGVIVNGKIVRGHTNFAGEVYNLIHPDMPIEELVVAGEEGVIKAAVTTAVDLCAVLNPGRIIFTGQAINEKILKEIEKRVKEHIPKEHCPKFTYGPDFEKYYIWGLCAVALK